MVNNRRGEYDLALNGISFVLKYDMNALAELEGALGEPLGAILEDAENKLSFRFVRAALYAGLVWDPRFKRKFTVEKAGDLITLENLSEISLAVITALSSALTGKTPSEITAAIDKATPALPKSPEDAAGPFVDSSGRPTL